MLVQRLHLQLHLAAVPEQDVTKIQWSDFS
jgi:hypothetical protein